LLEKTKLGELTLSYMDEAGFVQTQPNRSAWTETGEVHLITAARGKRLNVMAALISTGELFTAKFWETTTAALFGGFLGLLLESVGRPLTVILDNASIHKAKEIQPLLALLKEKGLTLYFLPPYSPELNRVEKLHRECSRHDEENDMTELRQRMIDAMILRGFALRTRETYLACVAGLAKHYHCSPDRLDAQQIQSYLLHLITEKKLAYASVNQAACACRFLFGTVLQQRKVWFEIPDGQGAQAPARGAARATRSSGCSPPATPCAPAPS
jgi:hypothetical protein